MELVVNGLPQQITYDRHAVEDLLLPLLRAWIERTDDGRRHWAFLVAAPGTGKSVLAELLAAALAPELQCVGIDGFHYSTAQLATRTFVDADGRTQPLASIKGAPETFDAEALLARVRASVDADVAWPRYDRTLHDVVPDADRITARHVLLEGNWLLLDDARWAPLRELADCVIYVEAPRALLRRRLVDRKMQGGLDRSAAEAYFTRSDGPNVDRVHHHSDLSRVDLFLTMHDDGSLHESDLA